MLGKTWKLPRIIGSFYSAFGKLPSPSPPLSSSSPSITPVPITQPSLASSFFLLPLFQ